VNNFATLNTLLHRQTSCALSAACLAFSWRTPTTTTNVRTNRYGLSTSSNAACLARSFG
jgi:hypothetical protein